MTPAEPGTDARVRADAALRARLAVTPLREPAPERVLRWQAALRELPSPARHGRRATGPGRADTRVPANGHAGAPAADPVEATEPPEWAHEGPGGPVTAPAGYISRRTGSPTGDGMRNRRTGFAATAKGPRPAVDDPAATATRPLSTADAETVVAKIARLTRPYRVAAAIGGLAAAITAVAVLGPTVPTQVPSAATHSPPGTGPAATHSPPGTGPAATHSPPGTGPAATAAAWPTGPSVGSPHTGDTARPAPPPASRLSTFGAKLADSEPLILTRDQLLTAPLTGQRFGPLPTSPAAQDLGPLAAPATLSACLDRFGSGAQPVAARRVVLDGRAGVVLVLPTDIPGRLRLLVVDPRCSTVITDDTVGR